MDRNAVTVDRGALWVREMDRNGVTVDRGALWVRETDRNAVTVARARTVERFGSARWTEAGSRSIAGEPWSTLGPPDGPKRGHGRPWSTLGPPDGPKRGHGRSRANRGALWVRQTDRNGVTVARRRTVEHFGSARWTEAGSRSPAREPWSTLGPPDGPKRGHGRPRANRGALWVRQMDRSGVTVDRARTVEHFGSARWTEAGSRSTAREPWSTLGPPDGPKRGHGRPRANRGALWVRQTDRNGVTVDRARTVEHFGSARWTEAGSRW